MKATGFALILAVLLSATGIQARAAEKDIVNTAVAAGIFQYSCDSAASGRFD